MPRLHHLICKSHVDTPLLPLQLAGLAHAAHAYTSRQQITGLLIYRPDGQCMHVLEGTKSALEALLQSQAMQPLQPAECNVVGGGPWARRSFPAWQLCVVGDLPAHLLGRPEFLSRQELTTLLPWLAPTRPALVHMVLEFADVYVE